MLEQFQRRLAALKAEYTASQATMAELDAQRSSLRDTMLRLSGAIQVLEEELTQAQASTDVTDLPITTTPNALNALNSEPPSRPLGLPAEIPLPSTYEILDANESL